VEDDDNIRELVVYALTSAGFEAQGVADGAALFAGLREAAPDLILLDIMLPGEDGIALLKKLKASARTEKIPVIMLTAKGAEHDRVKGLDLGADDYITKPFSVMEVISRVRAVLRRSGAAEKSDSTEMRVGGVDLCADKRSVSADGVPVALTYKEFELLQYLMVNKGIVLSRDKILEKIWGYDYGGESRTVDMHIKSLRQKLGGCGGVIQTVRNVGYKIEG
jgi:two-component system alkaline phosphatase synthesis response regulator PhoP